MGHEYTLYSVLFILLFALLLFWIYNKKSFDRHLYKFINLCNDITVITDRTKILAMNKSGLACFKVTQLNQLPSRYLGKLFEELGRDGKHYVDGINWVAKIKRNQSIRVRINFEDISQTYRMQVSKINNKRYLVTFHNITKEIAEKVTLSYDAEIDELTQIYNRKKFNTMLSYSIRKWEMNGTPFSIILFDIDHFKKINDTYGHDIGDKVLVELSALMKNLLRNNDLLARWGGEEFVILSPNTALKDAHVFANRLRKEIERFPFSYIENVTCSFGITDYTAGDTQESLLKKADEALYLSKANGRNRVSAIPS